MTKISSPWVWPYELVEADLQQLILQNIIQGSLYAVMSKVLDKVEENHRHWFLVEITKLLIRNIIATMRMLIDPKVIQPSQASPNPAIKRNPDRYFAPNAWSIHYLRLHPPVHLIPVLQFRSQTLLKQKKHFPMHEILLQYSAHHNIRPAWLHEQNRVVEIVEGKVVKYTNKRSLSNTLPIPIEYQDDPKLNCKVMVTLKRLQMKVKEIPVS